MKVNEQLPCGPPCTADQLPDQRGATPGRDLQHGVHQCGAAGPEPRDPPAPCGGVPEGAGRAWWVDTGSLCVGLHGVGAWHAVVAGAGWRGSWSVGVVNLTLRTRPADMPRAAEIGRARGLDGHLRGSCDAASNFLTLFPRILPLPAAESVPDLVLKHPRIFEYKVESADATYICKGRARIQVRPVGLLGLVLMLEVLPGLVGVLSRCGMGCVGCHLLRKGVMKGALEWQPHVCGHMASVLRRWTCCPWALGEPWWRASTTSVTTPLSWSRLCPLWGLPSPPKCCTFRLLGLGYWLVGHVSWMEPCVGRPGPGGSRSWVVGFSTGGGAGAGTGVWGEGAGAWVISGV